VFKAEGEAPLACELWQLSGILGDTRGHHPAELGASSANLWSTNEWNEIEVKWTAFFWIEWTDESMNGWIMIWLRTACAPLVGLATSSTNLDVMYNKSHPPLQKHITLWLFNIAMERSTIFKTGKPSISMSHLYHGKLLVITRGYMQQEPQKQGIWPF